MSIAKKLNKNIKGFTLVELIVTSILMAVVGSTIFTLYRIHRDQVLESSLLSIAQRNFDNCLDEMTAQIRASSRVLEPGTNFQDITTAPTGNITQIRLFDATGAVTGGYRIVQNTNVLQRINNTGNWENFQTGNGNVTVDVNSTSFSINRDRNEVTINLALTNIQLNQTVQLPTTGYTVTCRN